jgi:hypothetical protein
MIPTVSDINATAFQLIPPELQHRIKLRQETQDDPG